PRRPLQRADHRDRADPGGEVARGPGAPADRAVRPRRLPQLRRPRPGAPAAGLLRRAPGEAARGQARPRPGEPLPARAGDQLIVSGVPPGTSSASRRMAGLRPRTQPCELAPGITPGRLVPWTPTIPPPGQSVSASDVALVMNASGP